MLLLEVNGKNESSPVCWEEVNCGLFQRLKSQVKDGDDAVRVFSILIGQEFQRVWEAEAEDLEAAIYQATAFVFSQPEDFRSDPVPKTFRLGGKTVLIPKDIAPLTVGQNFILRGELSKARKENRPLESLLSIALAVYLQPLVDVGPFVPSRARKLEEEILAMNIYDVFPPAFFLLNRLQNSGSSGISDWHQHLIRSWRQLQRRLKWRSWLPSAICFSLIATLALTASCHVWFSRNPSTSSSRYCGPGRSAMSTTIELLRQEKN